MALPTYDKTKRKKSFEALEEETGITTEITWFGNTRKEEMDEQKEEKETEPDRYSDKDHGCCQHSNHGNS